MDFVIGRPGPNAVKCCHNSYIPYQEQNLKGIRLEQRYTCKTINNKQFYEFVISTNHFPL